MSKFTKAIGVFTLSAIGLAAQAIPVTQTIQTFGMVGLAEGQTAELNVLNPGVPPPALGVVCSATLSFLTIWAMCSSRRWSASRPEKALRSIFTAMST
jgi:hypothetical protein